MTPAVLEVFFHLVDEFLVQLLVIVEPFKDCHEYTKLVGVVIVVVCQLLKLGEHTIEFIHYKRSDQYSK